MSPASQDSCLLAEQAVGWALHALEPDAEMAVLLHIPHCEFCQATVREIEGVLASLGAAVEQVDPPASLRGSILAAAAEISQPTPVTEPIANLSATSLTAPLPITPLGRQNVTPRRDPTPPRGVTPRHGPTSTPDPTSRPDPNATQEPVTRPGPAPRRDGAPRPEPVPQPDAVAQPDATPKRNPPSKRDAASRPPTSGPSTSARPTPSAPGRQPPRAGWLSRGGRRALATSLALIAVLTVGGLGVYTAQLQQQRDAIQTRADGMVDFLSQLDRPDVRFALLTPTADGTTSVVSDAPTVAAVLVADGANQVFTIGLDSNEVGRTVYVLWGIAPGAGAAPQALGTFDVAAADQGVRNVGSPAAAGEFATYAISLEKGTTAPPAPDNVVALGQVQA